jgi:hypothetical protein
MVKGKARNSVRDEGGCYSLAVEPIKPPSIEAEGDFTP